MQGSVFSESWYKVSKLKVSLSYTTYIKKQTYRGEEWYVLEDKYNNQFFRLKPEAYEFISRLSVDKTVEEVWEESLNVSSHSTPSQDDVIQLLTSLHHKNLLFIKDKVNNEDIFKRSEKRKKSQLKGKLLSFLYLKIPLINPDKFLDAIKPLTDKIFSKYFLLIWLITLIIGGLSVVGNFSKVYSNSQGLLAPSNIFLLYACIVVLKLLHEFGHGIMVKKFGGKVNTMGVMLLVFTPIPFVDASQSWLFRSKYQRALVGAAGMIVELFFAAIAAIIWANTGDGLLNSISFNVMLIASVSSILFNGNPLLRFDSYFILSDILEIPNLYEKSKKQWFYLGEKYILRVENTKPISKKTKESFWLLFYGFFSFLYRLFVAVIIAVFVADQWLVLGALVLLISLYLWIIKPLYSFIKYLFSSQKLRKNRTKAVIISTTIFIIFFTLFTFIKFPYSIKANGIVVSKNLTNVYVKSGGYLKELRVKNSQYVNKGDILLVLENKSLDFDIKNVNSSIKESKAYLQQARNDSKADMKPINKHIELLNNKLEILKRKKEELIVRAERSGMFINENLKYLINTWQGDGKKLGVILPSNSFRFQAVVLQEEASLLFKENEFKNNSIKIYGLNEYTFETNNLEIIPYQKSELPSAALGWFGGGDIAVSQSDNSGVKTKEAFFEVQTNIINKKNLDLIHGRAGVLKIELMPLTIYQRLALSIKQIVQKRYKL